MAQNGLLARLELNTTDTPGNYGQLARLQVSTVPQSGQLARLEVTAYTPPQNGQLARLEVRSAATVFAGADLVGVEPGALVQLAGSGGDAGGTPVWSQVSGPTATLTQSGASASFRAPASLTGTSVVFRYSINGATDDVSVTILSSTHRVIWGGVECAAASYVVTSG